MQQVQGDRVLRGLTPKDAGAVVLTEMVVALLAVLDCQYQIQGTTGCVPFVACKECGRVQPDARLLLHADNCQVGHAQRCVSAFLDGPQKEQMQCPPLPN